MLILSDLAFRARQDDGRQPKLSTPEAPKQAGDMDWMHWKDS